MNKFSNGFTIVELVVVIAIIVILASIILFNVTGYMNKAKNAAVLGDLRNFETTAVDYYATNSSYAGICVSSQASTLQAGIASLGYHLSCYDIISNIARGNIPNSNIYNAFGLIPYAQAYLNGSPACGAGQFVAWVTKGSGDYICFSQGSGSYDTIGKQESVSPSTYVNGSCWCQ